MAAGSPLLVHVDVLGVDHLVGGTAPARRPLPARATAGRSAGAATGGTAVAVARTGTGTGSRAMALVTSLVQLLGQLVRSLLELRGRLLHLVRVLGFERLLGLGERLLELSLLVRPELLLVLVVGLLGGLDIIVEIN